MFHVPNEFRVKTGRLASTDDQGNNGLFIIKAKRYDIRVICSDGGGWEHVSVSLSNNRIPNWKEMCAVKEIFWDPVDCVMQLHPPASEYINNHPACLHLWRPVAESIPMPPSIMVGLKQLNKER